MTLRKKITAFAALLLTAAPAALHAAGQYKPTEQDLEESARYPEAALGIFPAHGGLVIVSKTTTSKNGEQDVMGALVQGDDALNGIGRAQKCLAATLERDPEIARLVDPKMKELLNPERTGTVQSGKLTCKVERTPGKHTWQDLYAALDYDRNKQGAPPAGGITGFSKFGKSPTSLEVNTDSGTSSATAGYNRAITVLTKCLLENAPDGAAKKLADSCVEEVYYPQ